MVFNSCGRIAADWERCIFLRCSRSACRRSSLLFTPAKNRSASGRLDLNRQLLALWNSEQRLQIKDR
jgi:hypothetical protein